MGPIEELAHRQHGVVAVWQLAELKLTKSQIDAATRGLRRVYRGVCAVEELTELGRLMAVVLLAGPGAALTAATVLQLRGLRPRVPGPVHVRVPGRTGRARRAGVQFHRPRHRFEIERVDGLPVVPIGEALLDATLKPHELYRVLEEADRRGAHVDRGRLAQDVVRLQRTVAGRTRSDAEAAFVLLCARHGLKLPRVNHRLNGFVTDFHWYDARLVVEVDGYLHHSEKAQFEEDRRRGLVHRRAGFEVIRASADQVYDTPGDVIGAVLNAAPSLAG